MEGRYRYREQIESALKMSISTGSECAPETTVLRNPRISYALIISHLARDGFIRETQFCGVIKMETQKRKQMF